nr:pectinesterase inhibitor 10-like [Coffea arabica]
MVKEIERAGRDSGVEMAMMMMLHGIEKRMITCQVERSSEGHGRELALSRTLGGHQNAHKRERAAARRTSFAASSFSSRNPPQISPNPPPLPSSLDLNPPSSNSSYGCCRQLHRHPLDHASPPPFPSFPGFAAPPPPPLAAPELHHIIPAGSSASWTTIVDLECSNTTSCTTTTATSNLDLTLHL